MAKVKTTNHQLAAAYDLVVADLFGNLKSLKEGMIKLEPLGTLVKKYRRIRNSLNGKTYGYYQVSFKASNTLKKALDK